MEKGRIALIALLHNIKMKFNLAHGGLYRAVFYFVYGEFAGRITSGGEIIGFEKIIMWGTIDEKRRYLQENYL